MKSDYVSGVVRDPVTLMIKLESNNTFLYVKEKLSENADWIPKLCFPRPVIWKEKNSAADVNVILINSVNWSAPNVTWEQRNLLLDAAD